ncbi:TonB-dependent receptor [Zhouia sp. PK063]|uniref:TonB-dependent receptor n=1 Tax=Zhouia sp. PK063 TaxID=3373602 RepID=UPI0037965A5E
MKKLISMMGQSSIAFKFDLKMRLTLLLLFAIFFRIQANTYSQNLKISLDMEQESIETFFSKVEAITPYKFLYNINDINLQRKVNVFATNEPLYKVLDQIFEHTNVSYKLYGDQIVLNTYDKKVKLQIIQKPQQQVSGLITDRSGIPLYGVSVVIKGTQKGTNTDASGHFSLSAHVGDVLVCTYMGFTNYKYTVTSESTSLHFILKEQLNKLDEVVLVGYGKTKKRDLTGSVSSVNVDNIKDMPVASVDNAMVGQIAGVQVIKADGSPGGAVRIKIRGGTSLLGGNDPLYIIDGVPVTVKSNNYINDDINITNPIEAQGYGEDFLNTVSGAFGRGVNSLAGLNISDIASIDVLKDASATAIYGSKAANGVVIITTKSGSYNQKMNINLNHYTSISKVLTQDVMNAQQFKAFYTVSAQNLNTLLNDGTSRPYLRANSNATKILNDPDSFFGNANTNWLDLVTRTAITNSTDLSISGGSQNTRYYTSLSQMDQQGTIINTGFKRISSVSKMDTKFSDKFSISTKVGLGFTKNKLSNAVYAQALLARPDYSVYDENGEYSILDTDYTGIQNPVALSKVTNEAKIFNLNGYFSAEYKFLKNLKFNSRYSIDMSHYRQQRYVPSFVDVGGFYGRESSNGGRGSNAYNESLRTVFENYFTYNNVFNNSHNINIVAGTAWEKYDTEYFSASGQGYPDDFILNNLGSASYASQVDGGKGGNSLLSFYVRANYNYKQKYFLTFTGRGDASSKFSPDNRWAIFPSAAAAWNISEESFLKANTWLNTLKIRASIGKVGTQNIGDDLYRTLYSPVQYAGNSATIPTTLGNNDLKWEETLQKDLGLDFALFNGKLSGTLGYYYKNTDGQLLNISVAPSSGFSSLITNIATVQNRGYEIELNAKVFDDKDVHWNMSFNISTNTSKVKHINGGPFSNPYDREALNLGTSIVKEGEPLGLLYGRVSNGLIRSQADLDDYRNEINEKLGGGFYSDYLLSSTTIGSIRYAISSESIWKQDIIGNSNPDFYGGFTNTISYKTWSLYTLFNFSYGNELIWQRDVLNTQTPSSSMRNLGVNALNYYTANNTNTQRPIPVYGTTSFLTQDDVYDASFIKLKQVTLNYNFPKRTLESIGLNSAAIYFAASNLFTITSYPGLDPEVSDDPKSIIGGGRDTDNYPISRTFALGVKVGL